MASKKRPNGYLSFTNRADTTVYHSLWVNDISQSLELTGTPAQSTWTRKFYPRSFAPGAITVNGVCSSQRDYQDLANFIRSHHIDLMATSNPIPFAKFMRLSIPSEALSVRGWIPKFTISKKGVFEPAPNFTFSFSVGFDHHSTPVEISHSVKKWFTPGVDDLVAPEHEPSPEVERLEPEHRDDPEDVFRGWRSTDGTPY